jgi:hypothetical protein
VDEIYSDNVYKKTSGISTISSHPYFLIYGTDKKYSNYWMLDMRIAMEIQKLSASTKLEIGKTKKIYFYLHLKL